MEKSTTSAPRLCSLPPTIATFSHNVLRSHYQLAQWHGTLKSDPPVMNPIKFGWETDHVNKTLSPRTVLGDVPLAPSLFASQIVHVKTITVDALVDICHAAYFVHVGRDTNTITRSIRKLSLFRRR